MNRRFKTKYLIHFEAPRDAFALRVRTEYSRVNGRCESPESIGAPMNLADTLDRQVVP